jgi:hypothetical protein
VLARRRLDRDSRALLTSASKEAGTTTIKKLQRVGSALSSGRGARVRLDSLGPGNYVKAWRSPVVER